MDIIIGIDPQIDEPAISKFVDEQFAGVVRAGIHLIGELFEKIKVDSPGCKIYTCIEIPFLNYFPSASKSFDIDADELFGSLKARSPNPETFRKQCESVGRIKEQIEPYCLQVFECRPSEWYLAILKGGRLDKRAERKRISLAYYQMRTGTQTKDDNITDAFAIGEYGIGMLRKHKLNKRIEA